MATSSSEGRLPEDWVKPINAGGLVRAKYTVTTELGENRSSVVLSERVVVAMAGSTTTGLDHVMKACVFNDRGYVVFADSLPGFVGLGDRNADE